MKYFYLGITLAANSVSSGINLTAIIFLLVMSYHGTSKHFCLLIDPFFSRNYKKEHKH